MEDAQPRNKWLIAITVMIGTLMSAIDSSIVNVALPHIQGNLGASVEEITWVSTGYILSNVIIMPIVAYLSSYFGRKRFFMFSVVMFTLTSMLCGLAWNLGSMVFFRILQGIGGGALSPLSQSIIRETFPPEEMAMAMGIYGLGVVLGPAFGPTLGGWLTDAYSWPWIFYINLPIGIVNIYMIKRYIVDPPYLVREKTPLDYQGLIFMALGLGALQIMLEQGNQKNWLSSNFIIMLAAVSFVGLGLFIWRELKATKPAVDLRILKDRNLATGIFLNGVLGVALMGSSFLMPQLLQQLLGYTAYDAGLMMIPRSLAIGLAMPLGGRIYNRLGPKYLIASGLGVTAISFYMMGTISLQVGFWNIFFPQLLQGIGFGLIFVALSTASFSSVDKPMMTAATGLYNVVRTVFGSIGIALSATLLTRGIGANRAILVSHVSDYSDTASNLLASLGSYFQAHGADAVQAQAMALKLLEKIVMGQASILTFNHIFFVYAGLFILAIPLTVLLKDVRLEAAKRQAGGQHD